MKTTLIFVLACGMLLGITSGFGKIVYDATLDHFGKQANEFVVDGINGLEKCQKDGGILSVDLKFQEMKEWYQRDRKLTIYCKNSAGDQVYSFAWHGF